MNDGKRLLLVDDDRELGGLLSEFLGREGYKVDIARDGKSGLDRAGSGEHALVILDIMLPELSGFDVLKSLRARSDVPVIALTARGDDVDRIIGLELGADDYLPKPFNPRELAARIKAVPRPRAQGGSGSRSWRSTTTPTQRRSLGPCSS
jgi:DNA-binding response OmpR family regulator